jgi:hypothetical protein
MMNPLIDPVPLSRHVSCTCLVALIVFASACSTLLDTSATQCRRDADCVSFGNAVCDTPRGVCVRAPPGPDAAVTWDGGTADFARDSGLAPCQSPSGCFACSPTSDLEFFSACTDATCVPFDNRARLKNLAEDGSLKPLP